MVLKAYIDEAILFYFLKLHTISCPRLYNKKDIVFLRCHNCAASLEDF